MSNSKPENVSNRLSLSKEDMDNFRNSESAAEDYPNATAWVRRLKADLRAMKPEWTRKDINFFIEDHFANDPVVKEVQAHVRASNLKSGLSL